VEAISIDPGEDTDEYEMDECDYPKINSCDSLKVKQLRNRRKKYLFELLRSSDEVKKVKTKKAQIKNVATVSKRSDGYHEGSGHSDNSTNTYLTTEAHHSTSSFRKELEITQQSEQKLDRNHTDESHFVFDQQFDEDNVQTEMTDIIYEDDLLSNVFDESVPMSSRCSQRARKIPAKFKQFENFSAGRTRMQEETPTKDLVSLPAAVPAEKFSDPSKKGNFVSYLNLMCSFNHRGCAMHSVHKTNSSCSSIPNQHRQFLRWNRQTDTVCIFFHGEHDGAIRFSF
jgi:hypothetical protein